MDPVTATPTVGSPAAGGGAAVEVRGVTKTHRGAAGDVAALVDASVTVPWGEAVAVVGQNGAGKSTLFRLVCGLARADRGTIEVAGHPVPRHLSAALADVGCLVDRPGFLGGLSGQANLEVLARRHGLGGTPVHEVLDRCAITTQARRRPFGSYSLGMRQRLGIAAALLGEPRLLVLDEPTNGLDPAGIAWVRQLVQEQVSSGGSVLLASHLLAEVTRVCQRVVVLHRGRVVRSGPTAELLATIAPLLRLRPSGEPAVAAAALVAAGIPAEGDGAEAVLVRPAAHQVGSVSLVLAAAGVAVLELGPAEPPLEALLREVARCDDDPRR